MGDYTLCHLHFSLKKETPKEIVDIIGRRLDHGFPYPSTDPVSISDFVPCTSAYHHVENFTQIESMFDDYSGEFLCHKFNTIFQAKYGRGIHQFINYITPWVFVDEYNRDCVGWTLSEYCKSPTYLFIKSNTEDPKDKYIQDLENKCKELVEKIEARDWKE